MVAVGLLDRQLVTLARQFEENGGFSERLYQVRKQSRDQKPTKPEPPEEHSV
jgi:four helix bundle suffix protein